MVENGGKKGARLLARQGSGAVPFPPREEAFPQMGGPAPELRLHPNR